MSTITIHAGDYPAGKAKLTRGSIKLPIGKGQGYLNRDELPLDQIEEIDIASEETVKRVGGTVGWGLAGAAVFGVAGLAAGLIAGGKKNEVTFVLRTQDGKKMLATTDSKTYKRLAAAAF